MKNKLYYLLLVFQATISFLFIHYSASVNSSYFLFSAFVFIVILIHNTSNIIFFIRTLILGSIGFLALATKLISVDALFGYHLRESQTLEIATLMFLLTNIALVFSELGFLYASKILIKEHKKIYYEKNTFFYLLFIILLLVSYFISLMRPDIITTAYGSGHGVSMPIQNLNTISNIFMYMLVFLYFKFKDLYHWNVSGYKKLLIFAGVFLYIYAELLHGSRLDALNGILGIIVISGIYKGKSLKITWKIFLIGVALFVLLQIIGIIRSALQFMTFDQLVQLVIDNFSQIFKGSSSGILFYQGTINDLASTFSGIIMMLQEKVVNFYFGSSYTDYILRTPPAILYPDRPQDLAWIFVNYGYTSGGGFFELAEAYLNFGVFGVMIVPFIVSFLFGYAYKSFEKNRYSLLHAMLLFGLLSGFVRGLLYQTFTLYKSVVTAYILFVFFYFLLGFIQSLQKKKEIHIEKC